MASGTYYPAASADDGFALATSFWRDTYDYLDFGNKGNQNLNAAVIRFPSVAIPQGVTITSAFVRLTAYVDGSSDPVNVNCHFEDVDDATQIVNAAGYRARTLTSAVAWNSVAAWTDGTQYDTPSLVSILQTVINRVGWSENNAVLFSLENNSSAYLDYRRASSFDYLSGNQKAELHVEWTVPDPNVNVSATTATLTITPNAATVDVDLTISPSTVALTITTNAATVVWGIGVNANTASLTITPNTATVNALAWLSGWDNRIKLTIDKDVVDTANQTNFPVMVYLSAASGIGDVDVSCVFDELTADANRKKIAVTSSDGTTELYVEIESWDDANEKATLHVKVPSVAYNADTILYLYYDADHADNDTYVGDTTDAVTHNVWDEWFEGVWHMAQDPNGDGADAIKDSTSHANEGTPAGTMLTEDLVDGQVGKGIAFDGTDDCMAVPDSADFDFTDAFTLEAIYDPVETYRDGRLIYRYDTTSTDGYFLTQYDSGSGTYRLTVFVSGSNASIDSDAAPTGAYQHIAGVRSAAGALGLYIDGAVQADIGTLSGAIDSSGDLFICSDLTPSTFGYGIIDEVRISSTERSAAWIKATHHSLGDSLITFGAEENNHIDVEATTATLTITPNAATVRVGTVAVFYPAVNGDDGYWNDTTGFFSTGDAIYLCNSTSFPRSCFIRFPNITIPNYATIISTHVTLTSFGYGDNETANANVYFNDSANAVAPTDLTTANALSLTNNVAAWNALPAWVDGTQYDTPSLVDELQEVIENPSWSHDNAVMLIIKDNSSTNDASRPASTVDFDGGSEKAELHVEYSLPDLNVEAITATLTATPKNATINIAAATATLTITPNTADAVFNIPINAALASLSITPNAVTLNTVVVTSVAPLTITPNAATRSWDLEVSATLNELTIATYDAIVFDGAEWAAWIAANESRASKYYYFILTGAADSLEDVTIPISSFQARRNYTSPTYLSVIIKDLTYADAISARSNGDMQIKMEYEVNGVVEQSSIMIEVDLEDISVNEGASNASIGLVGHRIEGYAPKSILLENIVYGTLKDGKYQYRCSIPNLYLSPGDTVTADGNEFTVDKISYIVSPKSQMMYVKEA